MQILTVQKYQYLHQMKKYLECSRSERELFLRRAEQVVDAFLEENPDAGPDEWYELLGTPEQFAGQLMEECDTKEVNRHMKRRITHITIASAILTLALVFISMFAYFYCITGGYIEIQTTHYVYISDSPSPLPTSK